MPIRTNRGRAAVYRKVWGWPLRSPMHLAVAGVSVVLIAVVVAVAVPRRTPNPGAAGSSGVVPGQTTFTVSEPQVTITQSSAPNVTRLTATPTPRAAAPAPAALATAKSWAAAWVHHPSGVSNAQWLKGLKPFTTAEFLPQMRSVNPANVFATKITGAPKVVHSYAGSAEVIVPTDGGGVDITVISTSAGWRVSTYTKAS
ncbi:MAG: hypothetical protein ACRDRL_08515 [Sciscionella sp.]